MFPYKIHAKHEENQVILLGCQPLQPMSGEDAAKLGHALVAAANGVAKRQAEIHGRPAPATDLVPHYEVPRRAEEQTEGRASSPPPAASAHGPRTVQRSANRRGGPTTHSEQGRQQGAGTDYTPTDFEHTGE